MLYKFFEQIYLIRKFERKIEELFSKGELFGTTHASIGQEAISVGVINALSQEDFITSNHRGHGHYIAYSNDPEGLMAEIMGKETGVVGGRGGSQHLQHRKFYSNGIQGGMVPIAAGFALAERLRKSNNIVVCFIGDGTLGQGILYESLNMASLWSLPILFVLKNNFYAMSTHIRDAVAGKLIDRGKAFGIISFELSDNDVEVVYKFAQEKIQIVREEGKPLFLIFNTYRQCGHSKSDDCSYRPKEEEEEWLKKDPIIILEKKLDDKNRIKDIKKEVNKRIETAYEKAKQAKSPTVGKGNECY